MGLPGATEICDLSNFLCIKFRQSHGSAAGFLRNKLPTLKKALKVEAGMKGIACAMV